MLRGLLLLMLLAPLKIQAQRAEIDSLLIVRDYLLEIRNAVNAKEAAKRKLEKLGILVRSAAGQKAIFDRNIRSVTLVSSDADQLKSLFNFVLQSVALYHSDLKGNHDGRSELLFLNKNIPMLVYKIDLHCKRAKISMEENTH